MVILQVIALGAATAVAYMINQSERRTWRIFFGLVSGFAVGVIAAGALAMVLVAAEGNGLEGAVRALMNSALFSLVGTLIGTYLGYSGARIPKAAEEKVTSNRNRIQWFGSALIVAIVLGALLLSGGQTSLKHSNAAECYLEKLPEVQNDVAAYATARSCIEIYPEGMNGVVQGSGHSSSRAFASTQECVSRMASNTQSIKAAEMIAYACRVLYEQPREPSSEINRFLKYVQ